MDSLRAQRQDARAERRLSRRADDPEEPDGANIVHLPTLKTHVFTEMTGAMTERVRRAAPPEAALDAQRDPRDARGPAHDPEGIHPGSSPSWTHDLGDGPGPLAMLLSVTNLMLASRDQVAIDAVAAN